MSQLPSATGMMQAFANADGIGPVFPSARPQICPGWPGWYFGIMAQCAQPGRRNKKGVETHISTYLYYGVFGYRVVEYGIL